MSFKAPGSVLYLIGAPQNALGASILLDVLGRSDERLPHIDYERALAQHALRAATRRARVCCVRCTRSATAALRRAGRDGIPDAASRRAPIGAQIDDPWQWTHGSVGELEAYFGEAGGFVVEVSASDVEAFEGLADDVAGVYEIGVTIPNPVLAIDEEAFDLARLHAIWSEPLAQVYP